MLQLESASGGHTFGALGDTFVVVTFSVTESLSVADPSEPVTVIVLELFGVVPLVETVIVVEHGTEQEAGANEAEVPEGWDGDHASLNETVPVYPLYPSTRMVNVADCPGLTVLVVGDSAHTLKYGAAELSTVT